MSLSGNSNCRQSDDEIRAKSYLAYRFGLFTGSTVRWYVEGQTEYFAIHELLGEPERFGVGLVNLRGTINDGNANLPMKLQDSLQEDRKLRRFSVITFDEDVKENVRAITRQAELGNIVGFVGINRPDFEFANFDLEELVEIAAGLDVEAGFTSEPVLTADWNGINNGKGFETHYKTVSLRKIFLKGEAWGRALGRYAQTSPRRKDRQIRPIVRAVQAASLAWRSNYNVEEDSFMIDPKTLERVHRPESV